MLPMTRARLEALVWRNTHADFRGKREDGTKCILHYVPKDGTCSVPLASLTDVQLIEKLSRKVRKDYGLP